LRGRFPRDLDAVTERFVVDRVEPDQQPGPALIMIGLEEDAGLRLDQMHLGLQWAGEGDSASTRPLPTKPLPATFSAGLPYHGDLDLRQIGGKRAARSTPLSAMQARRQPEAGALAENGASWSASAF
jgi:hypothetical protein